MTLSAATASSAKALEETEQAAMSSTAEGMSAVQQEECYRF